MWLRNLTQASKHAHFLEADVAVVSHHDVIDELNAEERASSGQAASERDVVRTRRGIIRRMVMTDDHAGSIGEERSLEDVARLDDGSVECAPADFVVTDNPVLRRQAQETKDLDALLCQQTDEHFG